MSVIGNFFSKSAFSISNLAADPLVKPDVAFDFNYYIYDTIKNGTAKSIAVSLYVKTGRNETLLSTEPDVYLVAYNTWQISGTIPASEWDGKAPIEMRFDIEDITDVHHLVNSWLIKD